MGLFDFLKGKKEEENSFDLMGDMLLNMVKETPQACSTDEIPQGKGEFGLESTNPIPIRTIPNNEIYLKSLRTIDDEIISWNRNGSMGNGVITGSIDIYDIYNSKGDIISTIYLCPYHWKTSCKAPKGFKLVK